MQNQYIYYQYNITIFKRSEPVIFLYPWIFAAITRAAQFDNSEWMTSHAKQPMHFIEVWWGKKILHLPDKSFLSKVFPFLQRFNQLWLIMALCALCDFYLNKVREGEEREITKEKLNTLSSTKPSRFG